VPTFLGRGKNFKFLIFFNLQTARYALLRVNTNKNNIKNKIIKKNVKFDDEVGRVVVGCGAHLSNLNSLHARVINRHDPSRVVTQVELRLFFGPISFNIFLFLPILLTKCGIKTKV
jgi:hypothetical protein